MSRLSILLLAVIIFSFPCVAGKAPDPLAKAAPDQTVVDRAGETLDRNVTCSIDFPDEETQTIIRNIKDLYGLNVIFPTDGIPGRQSILLRDKNWRFMFDEVLRPIGYAWREEDGVIRIYDAFPEFRKREAAVEALQQSMRSTAYRTQVFPLRILMEALPTWEIRALLGISTLSLLLNAVLFLMLIRRPDHALRTPGSAVSAGDIPVAPPPGAAGQ